MRIDGAMIIYEVVFGAARHGACSYPWFFPNMPSHLTVIHEEMTSFSFDHTLPGASRHRYVLGYFLHLFSRSKHHLSGLLFMHDYLR